MNQVPSIFAKNRGVGKAAGADLGISQHPRVSIQGGRFTLIDASGVQTPWQNFQLPVIVIGANPKKSRMYWETGFDPTNPGPPTCYSDNGVAPSVNASKKMARACGECLMASWESATSPITGKGVPACSTKKKIAVRVIGDANRLVYELQVPPTGLKVFQQYLIEIEKNTTPDGSRKADVSDVVSLISFKQGAIGLLEFNMIGWISSLDGQDGWHPNGSPDGGQAIYNELNEIIDSEIIDDLVGLKDRPFSGVLEGTILPPLPPEARLSPPIQEPQAPALAPAPTAASPFAGPATAMNSPQTAPQPGEPPAKRKPGRPKTVAPAPKEAMTSAPWASQPANVSPAPSAFPGPQPTPVAPNGPAPHGMQYAGLPPSSLSDAIRAAINLQPK